MKQLSYISTKTPISSTVHIADRVKLLRGQGQEILDFSAGRAAEASPDDINQAASQALLSGDTHQTMAQGKPEFRQAVAQKLKRDNALDMDPETEIMATLGCKNGLTLALMTIINPGDEVIVEDPCFVSYGATIGFLGGKAVPVALKAANRFRWTREDLEAVIRDRTKCILMCSPQNPTGTVHTKADLDLIAEIAIANDLYVISDEIYERATWRRRHHISVATLPGMKQRSIGLMGFTKTFSMGGWRIGYMYAPASVVSAMVKFQQHLMTCAGSFTQAGATYALVKGYQPEIHNLWQDWERRCIYVANTVNQKTGLSCQPAEGGFYTWIDIKQTGEKSVTLAERLLEEQHIALVPGSAFGKEGEGYLRMTSVKSWNDLREGVYRLKLAVEK